MKTSNTRTNRPQKTAIACRRPEAVPAQPGRDAERAEVRERLLTLCLALAGLELASDAAIPVDAPWNETITEITQVSIRYAGLI